MPLTQAEIDAARARRAAARAAIAAKEADRANNLAIESEGLTRIVKAPPELRPAQGNPSGPSAGAFAPVAAPGAPSHVPPPGPPPAYSAPGGIGCPAPAAVHAPAAGACPPPPSLPR